MRYNRELSSHLDAIPAIELLQPHERRQVGDDLAHYCRVLQGAQETSLREALASVGGSAASLLANLYFPGAEIILLALAAGFGLIALGRVYDIKRRERIINALVERIDDISWGMKR